MTAFVHLRLHTEYSLVDGVVRVDDLVDACAKAGMPACAVTDQSNLFAMVKFYRAAQGKGVKPIVGVDAWIREPEARGERGEPTRLTLLCQDLRGYRNLTRLVSRSYLEGQHKGVPQLDRAWLDADTTAGLIALSGAHEGDVGRRLANGRLADARRRSARFAAAVESVARDTEPVPLDGTRPGRADGATRAVARALGAAPSARRIEEVWCDLNGERGRALEWGFLETRALAALGAARRRAPAAFVGDLGSASGALLLALAAYALRAPRGAGGAALVCSASERGERAAAVLATPRPGGED